MSHKRPKHKRKEEAKLLKRRKSIGKRKEIYLNLISTLGLKDQFGKLPCNMREDIFEFSWPQIKIDSSEIVDFDNFQAIEEKIKIGLDSEFLELDEVEIPLSIVSHLVGLKELVSGWYNDVVSLTKQERFEKISKYKEIAEKVIDPLNYLNSKLSPLIRQIYPSYVNGIGGVAARIAMANYNFEDGIYSKIGVGFTETKKTFPIIYLKKSNIKKQNLEIEGQQRTGYPCNLVTLLGMKPIVFEKGVIDNENPLPVYIQDHAIQRLLERINIKPRGYLFDCIGRSLAFPKNAGIDGSSYLIEYNLYSSKLGYLVVSKTKDFALVRSFKFITMTGTPEFLKLSRTLRASKHDVTYLGLDTLEVLVNSDIRKDPKLFEIFSKCGLGHLFNLSASGGNIDEGTIITDFQNPKYLVAEEIKQYFNFE